MAEFTECPGCKRRLKLPAELLGQDVRCPACDRTFIASFDSEPPPLQVEELPANAPAPPLRHSDHSKSLVHCPNCGAMVDRDARRCRRCDASLGQEGKQRRYWEPHRGGTILTLGILSALFGVLSLCCGFPAVAGLGFGIPAWAMATHDMHRMRMGVMDRNGMANTQSGQSYAMVGVVLSFLCGVGYTFWFFMVPMRFPFR
jgi:uncharacterized paraquat-inducible protein A